MAAPAQGGFRTKTNEELHDFLKKRGVTVTKINKTKLIELCEAVDILNLPLDPDLSLVSSTADVQSKLRTIGCDNPFEMDGFTSCFDNIPSLTLYDVFNYLLKSKADYDKRSLKAYKSCEDYRLFFDGHVEQLQYNSLGESSTIGLFRAKVKPTQREKTYLNKQCYDLWVAVGKQHADIQCGYCTCIGGADGACRHLAAVLYEIEAFEVKSVTDGENQWRRRPRQHDCPVPIKRLKITKPRYEKAVTNERIQNFDPRVNKDQMDASNIEEFASALKEISPNIQALDVLQSSFDNDDTDPSKCDQHCVELSMGDSCRKFMRSNNYTFSEKDGVPDDVCQDFLDNYLISENDIDYIQTNTKGQSNNPNWQLLRKGRITASNFRNVSECVRKNKDPQSLRKTLLQEYGEAHAPSLMWGKKKEKSAIELYKRISKKKHINSSMEIQGLKVYREKPFLGCSVDGIFRCKCSSHQNEKVVEIKCPFSDRDKLPKEVAMKKGCIVDENGNFTLSKDSEYYHQVQGQMGICGYKYADLVIYTQLGIHVVEDIVFDSSFFESMLNDLEFYFRNILLKEMLIKNQ